ncbi:hypothetical protein HYPSUDRAFT_60431 [Hypholoma sublateritium FD-334 SS-4]|uniref:DnaJ homologue subfamily C member 28 conserved domain-containing protein n=1 Tax=Hypholoma sublateritium (strain FD-334 SS-4) TaxID=945553 RepID=A0A0D2MZK3_HYPSF|nr:hypothetical protein HYPSUDRAFT_60431 [Hypholoma sublateritium FD-334 SS-4]
MQRRPQSYILLFPPKTLPRHVYRTSLSLTRLIRWDHTSSAPTTANNIDHGTSKNSASASAKLFADAEKEESQEVSDVAKLSRLSRVEQHHPNWDGDERIEDAVLRMLVDKYKPLRTGTIQSAEEKIRQNPPKITPAFGPLGGSNGSGNAAATVTVKLEPTSGSWATETLLPSKEGHQPWHTQFKAPSTDISSVKLANMPPPVVRDKAAAQPLDDRARRKAREEKKRTQQVNKLALARESTLDYRLGIKGRERPSGFPNPATIKGWNSLIEDKIETARKAGLFNTVKGRGKPIERSMDEYNPFIAREEFLMNRIVQRNNAAPPWVEIQRELDTAVTAFREILREAWIRRTIRMLAMEHPSEILRRLTLDDIKSHRDSEWIAKEKSYHETAVNKLNSLVRNYNGLAPYAVRRAYYSREAEIEKLYKDCSPAILQALSERDVGHAGRSGRTSEGTTHGPAGGRGQGNVLSKGKSGTFFDWLRLWFRRLFGIGM